MTYAGTKAKVERKFSKPLCINAGERQGDFLSGQLLVYAENIVVTIESLQSSGCRHLYLSKGNTIGWIRD